MTFLGPQSLAEINDTPLHISFLEIPRGPRGIDFIFLDPQRMLNCNSSIPRGMKFSEELPSLVRTYLYLKCFTYLEDRWKKIRSNSWCDCILSAMTWGYALLQRRFEALVIFGWSLMTENATTSALKMG